MSSHRVVVTGLGAITPIGHSVPAFWDGLLTGKTGGDLIRRWDTSGHKIKLACEVKDYDPGNYFDRKESRRYERYVQFALIAAREAMAQSGIAVSDVGAEEFGAMIGSGIGGIESLEDNMRVMVEKGADRVAATLVPRMICNMATGQVSIIHGLKGPSTCVVTACASATHSIGDAFKVIQRGQAIAMLAGGAEAGITPLGIAGFQNMTALSSRNDSPATASRPFSHDRDGFVMGEGAGIMVLEQYDFAKARGAKILAEIVGYGLTCDAYHITGVAQDHEGLQRAMRMAMKDAGVGPNDIDYINAHGTSTPLNDKMESLGVKALFGEHARKLAVVSNKGNTGHLLGAAGGIESVAAIMSIVEGRIPATANHTGPDDDCDLDYVTHGPRQKEVVHVLKNNAGFGGHNAALLFRKAE